MNDYAYAGPPDIDRNRFIHLLALAGSPAAPVGWEIWDALVKRGIRPLTFLAHWNHESRMGTNGQSVEARYHTLNPGAVRSVENPEHGGVVIPTDRGPFVKYASYGAAAADWADRLLGPKYAGAGLTTVRQVIPKYAPTGDQDNQPVAYIASVLGFIDRHKEPPGMQIVDALTPINHWTGRDGHRVWGIVLHVTDGDTAAGAIAHFRSPASQVSAHYVVDTDGTIYQCVREMDTAWANGKLDHPDVSKMLIRRWLANGINPNRETVSIERVGHPDQPIPAIQLAAVRWLLRDVAARQQVALTREYVLGHYELDSVTRARCPSYTAEQWSFLLASPSEHSTDPLLDAEYERCGGIDALGAKVVKAHLNWQVDWGSIDADVLISARGVVSIAPSQTDTAQRMFMDMARETLEAAGVLKPYS